MVLHGVMINQPKWELDAEEQLDAAESFENSFEATIAKEEAEYDAYLNSVYGPADDESFEDEHYNDEECICRLEEFLTLEEAIKAVHDDGLQCVRKPTPSAKFPPFV
jgi:hypothetical protein